MIKEFKDFIAKGNVMGYGGRDYYWGCIHCDC